MERKKIHPAKFCACIQQNLSIKGSHFDDSCHLFSIPLHTFIFSSLLRRRRRQMPDNRAEDDDDAVSQSPGTVSAERKDSYDLVSLSAGTRVSGGRWTIIKELGQGAFGTVFLCSGNTDAGRRQAAMKTERADEEPFLWKEAEIMRKVSTVPVDQGSEHFCRCFDEGRDVQRDTQSGELVTFNYVVMSLIGRGLFDLLSKAGDVFSPGTAIGVSLQLLDALKALHKVGYLHLDVKPENATIGRAETNERRRIFLIDFGLARRYISQSGRFRRERSKTHFRGTPMYASIAAHARADYCRADDIESWFYTLVDMYTGRLPWTHVTSEHRTGKMKRLRLSHKPKEVQQRALHALLKNCPPIFYDILLHIDDLEFYQQPKYEWIDRVLRDYLNTNGIHELPYDWEKQAIDEEGVQAD